VEDEVGDKVDDTPVVALWAVEVGSEILDADIGVEVMEPCESTASSVRLNHILRPNGKVSPGT
jgi:hypothetical protein